jgi:GTP cyclohydrolase II
MVEGGARLITSLLRAHLVDRLVLCVAPIILGSGLEGVGDLDIAELARALELRDLRLQRLGNDVILSGELGAERAADGPTVGSPSLRGSTVLPTQFGSFELRAYELDGVEYPVMLRGNPEQGAAPLVRLHSECLTGEALGSLRCDCGQQLELALAMIAEAGQGALLYLRQEGRGIGLINKIRAYALQDAGLDTVQANLELGLPIDAREYDTAAQVLRELGIGRVRLITNNPAKVEGLEAHGIEVVERVPISPTVHAGNRRYLEAKVDRLGHFIDIA